jgi:NTP pyrophosphatase (non-canonical NTP hydrolase)
MTSNKATKLQRPSVTPEQIQGTINEMADFLIGRIKEKGDGAFSSRHEILGCVTEEYTELIDAVQSKDNEHVIQELFDVACSALFGIASIRNGHTEW